MSLRCLFLEIVIKMTKAKFQNWNFELNFKSERSLTTRVKNAVSVKRDGIDEMLTVK